ncbi:MAG: DUF1329 domain-containing protein [Candidatus Thiodiazotropha sp.]
MLKHHSQLRSRALLVSTLFMLVTAGAARAELSAEDIAKLGTTLTPLGAEAAGNAAGTIPAWTGGLDKPVAGFKAGEAYLDPYADEKPLYTITGDNADQFTDTLSEGQLAMLRKFPDYKLIVYPSHRSASFPQGHYDQTIANAAKAKLADNGNGVADTTGGIPFPIPKSGQEAIWNHLLRYRGNTTVASWTAAAVLRNGSFNPTRNVIELDSHYGNLDKPAEKSQPNRLFNFIQSFTSPPRLAGTTLLVYEPMDQVKESRTTWVYSPGQRRVRLAPEIGYDNPANSTDGLATNDDFNMYNGAIDRYDWKLIGKREIHVPYNSYRIVSPDLKHTDLVQPGHLNQDHARYELHRVWVVEATVKEGVRHAYAKRVFYLDEDSWAVLLTDRYDARGQLWRAGESHAVVLYDIPLFYTVTEAHYDLHSGRYLVRGLYNEEKKILEQVKRTEADFTPGRLRDLGVR